MLPTIRRKRTSRDPDGIIAPRTPAASRAPSPVNHYSASPLPSPSAMMYSPCRTTLEGSSGSHTSRFATFQNETLTRHRPFLMSPPPRRATSDGLKASSSIGTSSASGISTSNGAVSLKDEGKEPTGRRRINAMHLDIPRRADTNGHLVLIEDENNGSTL